MRSNARKSDAGSKYQSPTRAKLICLVGLNTTELSLSSMHTPASRARNATFQESLVLTCLMRPLQMASSRPLYPKSWRPPTVQMVLYTYRPAGRHGRGGLAPGGRRAGCFLAEPMTRCSPKQASPTSALQGFPDQNLFSVNRREPKRERVSCALSLTRLACFYVPCQ